MTLCEWHSPSAAKGLHFITLANLIKPRTCKIAALNTACGQMAALLCLMSVRRFKQPMHCWTPTNLIVFMMFHLCIFTSFLIMDQTQPSNFDSTCNGPIYWATLCIYIYTGCPRRNVPDFGRVFLMLKYTDITQNTYVQSWTVTEMMAREKCGLIARPHTVIPADSHWPCVWRQITTSQQR